MCSTDPFPSTKVNDTFRLQAGSKTENKQTNRPTNKQGIKIKIGTVVTSKGVEKRMVVGERKRVQRKGWGGPSPLNRGRVGRTARLVYSSLDSTQRHFMYLPKN